MSNLTPPTTATHLHLPSWWVRAFDAAVQAESGDGSAASQAQAAALVPALAPLELQALAMVLGSLQEQIFSGGPQPLRVSLKEHLKHLSSATRSRRFMFERVVQMLGGLRLLQPLQDGAYAAYAPFQGESWHHDGGGDMTTVLTLAPLGPEILLGCADAHHDFTRLLLGEPEAKTLLGEAHPLVLSRSLWLELQGVEQLLHLRMERAVQWDFRWLQLEGIFGLSLAQLFCGVPLPEAGKDAGTLSGQLKCLARLGRKLAAHGSLLPAVGDHYLALGAAEDHGTTLIWQASRERLASATSAQYRVAAATSLARWHGERFAPLLAKLCLPPDADVGLTAEAVTLHRRLASMPEATAFELAEPSVQSLNPAGLFYEMALRQQPGSWWPLPEEIKAHALATLSASLGGGELAQRFAGFCQFFNDSPELSQALGQLPFMTLTSKASRQDASFTAKARERLAGASAYRLPAVDAASDGKPRLIAPPPAPADVGRRGASSSPTFASRMLKTAADELAKMRATDVERYLAIKRAYLTTLDDTSRRLLLDVQKRIQPAMFEEQLRQRLVRYMVDNPGAWRSAEASKAGNP